MRRLEKIFKALGDRNRLRILKMLEVKPMCVCEITAVLGIAQSSVSRHLSILRGAGLIIDEKYGLWVEYSLVGSIDDVPATIMTGLRRWENSDTVIQRDREMAETISREELCSKP
ncbi:MAG: metalloregulator ArsR/SmtB family transcription factor [Candidatus Auribacterota bacterium]|nr:metalloregulator ArsR/SmtB family transcription factor [Candidatus Auribacterota bacterium]